MGFYDRVILPRLINVACGMEVIDYQRNKVVPHAQGRVLEVGMGSGLNMPFYTADKVELVYGLEPNLKAQEMAAEKISASDVKVDFIGLDGQEIPLDNDSVDTVVLTYTLCTIPDAAKAMTEMRRVLKPGGQLLFSEHGKAPDEAVVKWQNRLNGTWQLLFGGCNLNREIPDLIEQGGFKMQDMSENYVPGPKFATYTYWGSAV